MCISLIPILFFVTAAAVPVHKGYDSSTCVSLVMASRVDLNRTTARRTSVRDSGIGLASGYGEAYAAGVGLPPRMPINMANDANASRRPPGTRNVVNSLAGRGPARTGTPSFSYSRDAPDYLRLSAGSTYTGARAGGDNSGRYLTSASYSMSNAAERRLGGGTRERDSLYSGQDGAREVFAHDTARPAGGRTRPVDSRKWTGLSDSEESNSELSAHSRVPQTTQGGHMQGRRHGASALGSTWDARELRTGSEDEKDNAQNGEKDNGVLSAASTRGGSATMGRRAVTREGAGSGGLWDRWKGTEGDVSLDALGQRMSSQPRALVGLSNLGNTCFMNSCLQCLSHTAPLSSYFIGDAWKQELNKGSKSAQLAQDYASLCHDLWSAGRGSINPSSLKMQISRFARQFSGFNQHDSQELLRFLIDGMQEGLQRPKKAPPWPYDDDDFDKRPLPEQSRRMWENYLARNDSFVTRVFCGQLRSNVVCAVCRKESNCYDPFMDLSLPIPKGRGRQSSLRLPSAPTHCSLHDCLADFVAEERLEGQDTYYCSKCKAHQNAGKSIKIFRLPPVLVLHLKRFDKHAYSRAKINTVVDFPVSHLDLRSDVMRLCVCMCARTRACARECAGVHGRAPLCAFICLKRQCVGSTCHSRVRIWTSRNTSSMGSQTTQAQLMGVTTLHTAKISTTAIGTAYCAPCVRAPTRIDQLMAHALKHA